MRETSTGWGPSSVWCKPRRSPTGRPGWSWRGWGGHGSALSSPGNRGFRASIELRRVRSGRPVSVTPELEALARNARSLFDDYIGCNERLPRELSGTVAAVVDRVRLAHLISGHLLLSSMEKQELLEALEPEGHLEIIRQILVRELEICRIEEKLDEQIQQQMDSGRRQHYLQEQLKAITKELGSPEGEWAELEVKLRHTPLPAEAKERAEREMDRLRHLNPVAPEAAVIRTYLDWILGLPWMRKSEDTLDVANATRILNEAHFGLDEVKERILDHIAVLSLVGNLQGPILCLVGPPGVGKTSLGKKHRQGSGKRVHPGLSGRCERRGRDPGTQTNLCGRSSRAGHPGDAPIGHPKSHVSAGRGGQTGQGFSR